MAHRRLSPRDARSQEKIPLRDRLAVEAMLRVENEESNPQDAQCKVPADATLCSV